MLLTPSPIVSEMRGRISNATLLTLHGRTVLRRYAAPTDRRTPAQLSVRNAFARLNPLWASLHSTPVAWWDLLALAPRLLPKNLFFKHSLPPERLTDPVIIAPPHLDIPPLPGFDAASYDWFIDPPNIFFWWTDPVIPGFTKIFAGLRNKALTIFDRQIDTINASEAMWGFLNLSPNAYYHIFATLYNPTTGVLGTQVAKTVKALPPT